MESTARNRTIGGIVVGAILLVLLLILFSCTLASDPEKKSKKTDSPVSAPSATTTLSPQADPTEKPKPGKKKPTETTDTAVEPVGYIPAVSTGVTYEPPGMVPSGFSTPTAPVKPPSVVVGICVADPGLPQCNPSTPPVGPPAPSEPPVVTSPEPTPPACPRVSISNVRTRSATVSWSDVSGADAYLLTLDGTDQREFDADTLSTRLRGLNPILPHFVKVQAVDNGLGSRGCGTSTIILQPLGDFDPPADPTGLTCTAGPSGTASLDWDDNAEDDFDSYNVYTAVGRDESYRSGVNGSETTVDGLEPGTAYTFSVSALDESGNESGRSDRLTWPDDCDHKDPMAPTNVSVATTGTAATVSWTPSTDDTYVDHYIVTASKDGQQVGEPVQVGGKADSASVTGLEKSTAYTFVITAFDPVGNSAKGSGQGTTTDKDDTRPPSVPQNVTISNVTSTSFDVTWTKSTDDQSVQPGLVYTISVDGVNDKTSPNTVTGDNTYTVTYNEPLLDTTATVSVTATDQAGNTSAAGTASTEVPAVINVPLLGLNSVATKAAPATRGLSPRQSASPSQSASPTTSSDPSGVPSLPAILDPLIPGGDSASSEPAAPETSEPAEAPSDAAPKATTEEPSKTPDPTPTQSDSPAAKTDGGNGLNDAVAGVLDAVAGAL